MTSSSEVDLDDTKDDDEDSTAESSDMAPRRPQDTNNNSKRDLENVEASNNDNSLDSQISASMFTFDNFHTNDGLNFTC